MTMLWRYDFLFHINCFLVAYKTFPMTPKNQGMSMTILATSLNNACENVKNCKLFWIWNSKLNTGKQSVNPNMLFKFSNYDFWRKDKGPVLQNWPLVLNTRALRSDTLFNWMNWYFLDELLVSSKRKKYIYISMYAIFIKNLSN